MKSSDIEKKIIGCIKGHGLHGASSTEISKALGINRHTLANYLNILHAEAKITFKRAGMGKIWFMEKSSLHGVSNGSKDIADTGLKTTLGHILSTMPDGIVVENENYEIEFMNDSLVKKFGNLVGEKCYRAFIGRSEPCVKCPVIEILHKGNPTSMRYQATDKDGNSYDLIASSMKNPDGSVSVIEMVRDITDMKQAEEALRESEERYRFLFEQSPIGIGLSSIDGKVISSNKVMEDITGYSIEEFKKINLADTYENPEDRKSLLEAIKRDGGVANLHVRLKRKDGTPYDALLNISRVHIGGKDLFQTMCIDITDRKNAEEALRESEEEFRLTFENAKDAILWADPETGLIINCNKATETLLERRRHEIIGQHQTKLHPPEKSEYYSNQFKEHMEQKGAVDDEAEIITKSGKIKPVHISASVTVIGEKPIMQGIFRDITERKKAESQIKYLNEIKRSVIDNAPFGILTGDKNGNIIHANPALIQLLGSPSAEKTKSFNLFKLPAIKKAGLDKVFGEVLSEGREFDLEREYVSHWGKRIFARIKALPLRDAKGEITGLVTIVEDITERKNLEMELNKLRGESKATLAEPLPMPEAQSISP